MVVHNVRVVWETQGGRIQCKGGMGDSGWSYTM